MNTSDELDACFERVPEHVLTVIDQAYFEYVDRADYPDAIERYFKRGREVVVLRTFSKIYGLAGQRVGYAVGPERCHRGDDEGSAAVRPDDHGAGRGGRERSTRARRSTAAARSTPRDWPGSRILPEHGFDPAPAVGNFVYVERGGDVARLSTRCSTRA